MRSSALFRFFFFSSKLNPTLSGGAMNASSLVAFRPSVTLLCFSAFFLFSIFSFSCGLRKYSPDASCKSSFEGCCGGGKGV
jgi:hypothetical protein